jgi:hypothetical protein
MSNQVACSTIEHLREVIPGQKIEWYMRLGQQIHDGKMPMPSLDGRPPSVERIGVNAATPPRPMGGTAQVVEIYRSPPQAPTTTKPAPEPPPNVVSEETKAKLLALCKSPEMAESYVAAERRWTNSEERAWQRAYNKLTEENEQELAEKVKLYSNFGFYS